MSFSEEDKEALSTRLDEIQESLDELENLLVTLNQFKNLLVSINQEVTKIAQIALSFFLVMLVGLFGGIFIAIM